MAPLREEIGWWLEAGERDLLMARTLLSGDLFEGVAFHAQQAGEKFLKAGLLKHGQTWQRTHSCTVLVDQLEAAGVAVGAAVRDAAQRLDLHYLQSRYPNSVGGAPARFYSRQLAEEAIQVAERIHDFVRQTFGL